MTNSEATMSEAAKAAKREYYREWYKKNKERRQAYLRGFWERKAAEAAERKKTV